jgi:hypothetical protein
MRIYVFKDMSPNEHVLYCSFNDFLSSKMRVPEDLPEQ